MCADDDVDQLEIAPVSASSFMLALSSELESAIGAPEARLRVVPEQEEVPLDVRGREAEDDDVGVVERALLLQQQEHRVVPVGVRTPMSITSASGIEVWRWLEQVSSSLTSSPNANESPASGCAASRDGRGIARARSVVLQLRKWT